MSLNLRDPDILKITNAHKNTKYMKRKFKSDGKTLFNVTNN